MSKLAAKSRTKVTRSPSRGVSRQAIARLAYQIAEKFQPKRIILFGSYAYGTPTADSDVDLLVVMPTRNMTEQACRIRSAVEHPFPLDLLVRTPEVLKRRLAMGDWFLREIVDRGKVLYEEGDRRVGAKSPSRRSSGRSAGKDQAARE